MMPGGLVDAPEQSPALPHDDGHERQQRGTRQILAARACFFGSSYVVSAILARRLGAVDFGIYGVVISQLLWLEMVVNAGVPAATAKLMADARRDGDEVARSARTLLVGCSIVMLAAGWLVAPAVARLMHIEGGAILFRIAFLEIPFAAMLASYDGIFYGRRWFGSYAIVQTVYGLTRIAAIISLFSLGFSVGGTLIATVASTSFMCVVVTATVRPRGFQPDRQVIRQITGLAAPVAAYLVSSQVLLNLDLWSLKSLWTGPGDVVGRYVAASNLARTLMIIPAAQAGVLFASVAFALAARNADGARQRIQEAVRFAMITGVAACILLSLNASQVLTLLYSGTYAGGDRFLRLLLVGCTFYALLDAFANALMAAGRPWSVAAVIIANLLLAWVSNYVLIPRLGPMGAATSMVIGLGVATCWTGAMAYRHFRFPVRSTLVRVLVAAIVTGLVSRWISVPLPLIVVKLGLLGVVYLLVLRALGEITADDFRLWARSRVA